MSVTKTYTGGKAMRFYINWNGKEYPVTQITWYSWGKIMQVTIYDDNHNLRTIYHDSYDLESNIYTKNATATNSDKERKKLYEPLLYTTSSKM